jgi:hypothetical protein
MNKMEKIILDKKNENRPINRSGDNLKFTENEKNDNHQLELFESLLEEIRLRRIKL